MVAPYEVGDPTRLFVRVPGSGRNKEAKSLCCDLSKVSSAAASVPVWPAATVAANVSTAPRSAQQQRNNGQNITEKEEKVQVKVEKKEEPVKQEPSASPQQNDSKSCKRRLTEESDSVNTPKRNCVSRDIKIENQTSKSVSSLAKKESSADEKIQNLEKQCKDLKQQNLQLQQRLSLFCKLFKDPKKLQLALKHMQVKEN